jgi:hypothetical protein
MATPDELRGSSVESDDEGMTVYLKISYRTVLLIVVIANVIHFSISGITQVIQFL